ncbi:hypothetical protein ACF0H5_007992 [Mactra antiquata]
MFLMGFCSVSRILFIILTLGNLVRSQSIKESCVNSTLPNKSARFDCGNNGMIAFADVKSGTGSCFSAEGSRCYGLTPQLLVSKLNCYWKRNCTIEWPDGPLLLMENGDSCIGHKPEFLELKYKCFRPDLIIKEYTPDIRASEASTVMIDICSHLANKKDQYELTGKPNLSGIIRSHAIYPWDYSSSNRTCIVNIYWPQRRMLVVSVQDIELGEGDYLQIGNHTIDDETPSMKRLEFRGSDSQFNTMLNFTVGRDSNGGKGFVVCFKFTDVDDKNDHSVCDDITAGGNIIHFSDKTTIPSPILAPEQPTKTTTVAPVTLNKKCEKKKTPKKKKRCYDKLNRTNGGRKKKKNGGKKGKKRKNRKE